ncbi:hypothetical protein [Flavobacterium sp. WC2509]|uniref:hypothetical protein n=1 Tax=Flavobacterium sp. WC2509 TaxID=3461406 RepID=UPI0040442F64
MNITLLNIINTSFEEMIAFSISKTKNIDFDIIIENEINKENYCLELLHKFNKMPLWHFSDFIDYQMSLVSNHCKWLHELEVFIHSNETLFTSKTGILKYNKIFQLIEQIQINLQSSSVKETKTNIPKKHINAENEDRYFSFYELKKQLDKTPCDKQKIILLTKERHDYKQSNIEFINLKIPLFDKQCSKEIEQIYELLKLKTELEESKPANINNPNPFNKMRFNGNLNQLVDIFYQLNRELFVDGKSYIDGNTNDLVALIVNSFVDKDGKEISPLTVKTILKPSKEEKRPNTHKRIDIEKFL